MKKQRYAWIVIAAVVPVAVMAQTGGKSSDRTGGGYGIEIEQSRNGDAASSAFRKVDTDSSGFIDREEAKAVAGLQFAEADNDHDGKLSSAEFEAAISARKERMHPGP